MSIAYNKLIMAWPNKYIEFKLYKLFNILNPLKSNATLEDMEKILKFYTKNLVKTLIYKQ